MLPDVQPISRLIVGIDLDDEGAMTAGARSALDQAIWLARQTGASVTALHATRPDERWLAAEQTYETTRPSEGAATDALERVRGELEEQGLDANVEVTKQRPGLALCRAGLRTGADFVVVGTRSEAEADGDGRPLGSVALTLLRKFPTSTWVVRPHAPVPAQRLVAATDLSSVGDDATRLAASLATAAGAALTIVHALQLPLAVQLAHDQAAYLEKARARAITHIRQALGETAGVEPRLDVGLTSPTRAILEEVAQREPDLVVMGSVSRGGIPGLLMGNTAERLLGRLSCSVVCVKPADFACPVTLD